MNVLMTGVGGQGIILASDVLSEVMMRYGYDVKKSEIHGMAQRGGSVMSHVRFSREVASPLIPLSTCDILLSFEELETARYVSYLNKGTHVIINRYRLLPPTVIAGTEPYPLRGRCRHGRGDFEPQGCEHHPAGHGLHAAGARRGALDGHHQRHAPRQDPGQEYRGIQARQAGKGGLRCTREYRRRFHHDL